MRDPLYILHYPMLLSRLSVKAGTLTRLSVKSGTLTRRLSVIARQPTNESCTSDWVAH